MRIAGIFVSSYSRHNSDYKEFRKTLCAHTHTQHTKCPPPSTYTHCRYEEQLREQQNQVQKEDLSDMVAEHAAKQKVRHEVLVKELILYLLYKACYDAKPPI